MNVGVCNTLHATTTRGCRLQTACCDFIVRDPPCVEWHGLLPNWDLIVAPQPPQTGCVGGFCKGSTIGSLLILNGSQHCSETKPHGRGKSRGRETPKCHGTAIYFMSFLTLSATSQLVHPLR